MTRPFVQSINYEDDAPICSINKDDAKEHKYKPIIDFNKRNIKNESLIKKLSNKDKLIYRKRIKVENAFSIIKKYRRIDKIIDSYFKTYSSFLHLGLCILIAKYIDY